MNNKFCIFAGTTEGRNLVEFLSAWDCTVTACVATEYGSTLLTPAEGLTVLEKRLDAEEMETLFRQEKFDLVVDATHPYAAIVTENIHKACEAAGTEYLRLLREESEEVDGAVYVSDVAEAVEYLNTVDGNILLTTGSKELQKYTGISGFAERVYARLLPMQVSLDACEKAGVKVSHIIALQGPFSVQMNEAMIESSGAKFLVTKDGGSTGGFAEKAIAAKNTGIKMVIIGRPAQLEGKNYAEVLEFLAERFGFALSPDDSKNETQRKNTGGLAAKAGPNGSACSGITIVGIGPGSQRAMTIEVKEAIEAADCLIGAKRMIEAVRRPGQAAFEAISPDKIASCIEDHPEFSCFTIVMSGDSGFFSGTKKLLEKLGHGDVSFAPNGTGEHISGVEPGQGTRPRVPNGTEGHISGVEPGQGTRPRVPVYVLPGLSSLSYFCARLGLSYENVKTVSMHGRNYNIVPDVQENELVFVLTGGDADIKEMAKRLRTAGLNDVTMHVAERLSYPEERIVSGTPAQIEEETFDKLSVVLIENGASDKVVSAGLPDDVFIRGEGKRGVIPMTKSEVRAICLSKLQLTQRSVCWDVGAGTGSVSVEMAILAQKGRVYAVEKNEDAVKLLEKNKEQFMADNLEIIPGTAPSVCEDLPVPTHVFIGGSSGNIRPVIDLALAKNPSARIVATAITLESAAELSGMMKEFDFAEAVLIHVSADKKAGPYHLMMAQNPIYIFSFAS